MIATKELPLIQYGKFKLHLNDLADFFFHIYRNQGSSEAKLVGITGLGANKVENFRYYLRDLGLLTPGKYTPTPLGELVYEYDPRFIEEFTQWVLLYNWSRRTGNPVLHFFLNEVESEVNLDSLETLFLYWAKSNNYKSDYQDDTIKGLVKRTKEALTDNDAFSGLNVIREVEPRLLRGEPYNVHPLLVAYILHDNRSAQQHSIAIDHLLQEHGNIGKFFGYDTRMLEYKLGELVNLDIIKRVQVANLNMIEFKEADNALAFVEKYYVDYT